MAGLTVLKKVLQFPKSRMASFALWARLFNSVQFSCSSLKAEPCPTADFFKYILCVSHELHIQLRLDVWNNKISVGCEIFLKETQFPMKVAK